MLPDALPPDPSARAAALGLAPMALPPLPEAPLVSVLISNYNYAAYVRAAVESVLAQTYPRLEVVVVDDGSTDDSLAVLAAFDDDPRVTVVAQANAGQAVAINTGVEASRGEIVCLMDADDLFEPTRVARAVEMFRASPRAGLAACRVLAVDADDRPVLRDPAPWPLSQGWCAPNALGDAGPAVALPPTSALAARREVAERLHPIDPALRGAADGYWHRLAPLVTEIAATPEPLVRYRHHGRNLGAALFETPATLRNRLRETAMLHAAARRGAAAMLGESVAAALGPLEADAVWVWNASWAVLIEDASAGERRRAAAALLARPGRVRYEAVFRTTVVWPALGALMLRTAVTDNPVKRAVGVAKRLRARLRG